MLLPPPSNSASPSPQNLNSQDASTPKAQNYYSMLQVRLYDSQTGSYDTSANLSGLTFQLYEQQPDNSWILMGTAISSYKAHLGIYVAEFGRISGASPDAKHKVVLAENISFTMPETEITLGGSEQQLTPSTSYFLDLTRQAVSTDNADAAVDIISSPWTGTGTSNDPKTASATVDRFTSAIRIYTADSHAAILYNNQTYTGGIDLPLNYGKNNFEFRVTSQDGTQTIYYMVSVTREKYQPLKPSNLKGQSPSSIGGSDGKITGLSASTAYEYRKDADTDYTAVAEGATEITGLTSGTYFVRTAETDSRYPSPDTSVTIPEPIAHKVTLDEASLPANLQIVQFPDTMVEGHMLTMQFLLPKNHLLDKVSYSYQTSGGITVSSPFSASNISYTQQEDQTLVTVSANARKYDTTIKITLKDGEYYSIDCLPEGDGSAGTKASVTIQNTETVQGGISYYKAGEITADVKLSNSWTGYAGISSLTACVSGTDIPIEDTTVVKNADNSQWTLTFMLTQDTDIRFDVHVTPGDMAALDNIVNTIGDLDKYVDDANRKTVEQQLQLVDAYKKLPAKQQNEIDNFVALLTRYYNQLTLRTDLTDNAQVTLALNPDTYIYDGHPWKPELSITYNGILLIEGTDYSVTYPQDMTAPGIKVLSIEYIGNYTGSARLSGEIIQYFTIQTNSGPHGSISPSGPHSLKAGDNQDIVIKADDGFQIQEILIDGKPLTLKPQQTEYTYTINDIRADISIEARFEKIPETEESETETESQIQSESQTETQAPDSSKNDTTQTDESQKISGGPTDTPDAPKTGDHFQPFFWLTVLSFSLTIIGAVLMYKKETKTTKK